MSVHSSKRIQSLYDTTYVTQAPDVRNYLVTYKYPSYDSVSPCLRHDLTSLTGTLMTLVSRRSLQSPRPRLAIRADIWTQFRCPGPGHRSHQVMCRPGLAPTHRQGNRAFMSSHVGRRKEERMGCLQNVFANVQKSGMV